MFLLYPFDGVRSPQPTCRLLTPFCVVVVVVLESPDLVLELLAYLHHRPVLADFGGEGDVSDVRERVVHYPRLGVVSAQVLQVVSGILSCSSVIVTPGGVDLGAEDRLSSRHHSKYLRVVAHDGADVFGRGAAAVL